MFSAFVYLVCGFCHAVAAVATVKLQRGDVDDLPRFDGVGAISAGGAVARLLIDYPEPQRSQVLDYLFRPGFGASLQHLKVELGGDAQSTDGTESSHMHSKSDLDFSRGYEWWLLSEAKKRNPQILLSVLPWAFPGWVGNATSNDPYLHRDLLVLYVTQWVTGARLAHNLTMDYIGVWNERWADATYVKMLRRGLDARGFSDTKIVVNDGGPGCDKLCDDLVADAELFAAVEVVGQHYPQDCSTRSPLNSCVRSRLLQPSCFRFDSKRRGSVAIKPLWASEESSSFDNLNGAACWGRVLTQHFVVSGYTASLMWNVVGAYFHGTDWYASSLMTADQPWSGHYSVSPVIWATAHYTHFVKVGWRYLPVGRGSGTLANQGHFVSLVDGDERQEAGLTVVVEKMSRENSFCTRPELYEYEARAEDVVFDVGDVLPDGRRLAVWRSNFEQTEPILFQRDSILLEVREGKVGPLHVAVGDMLTLTTLTDVHTPLRQPSQAGNDSIPRSRRFELPWEQDFREGAGRGFATSTARYLSDQKGVFELVRDESNPPHSVLRQVVPEKAIEWDGRGVFNTITVVGWREWQDVAVSVVARFPLDNATYDSSAGICVGVRGDQFFTQGLALCVAPGGGWTLRDLGHSNKTDGILAQGSAHNFLDADWHQLNLTVACDRAWAAIDGRVAFDNLPVPDVDTGFVGLCGVTYAPIEFASIAIDRAGDGGRHAASDQDWLRSCAATSAVGGSCDDAVVVAAPCSRNALPDVRQEFRLLSTWQIQHVTSGLCISANLGDSRVSLQKCDGSVDGQKFRHDYTWIRNFAVPIHVADSNFSLFGNTAGEVGVRDPKESATREGGAVEWWSWAFFPNSGQLRNQYVGNRSLGYPMCLTVCDGRVSVDLPSASSNELRDSSAQTFSV